MLYLSLSHGYCREPCVLVVGQGKKCNSAPFSKAVAFGDLRNGTLSNAERIGDINMEEGAAEENL